jgi:hypothetical protein
VSDILPDGYPGAGPMAGRALVAAFSWLMVATIGSW